MATIDDVKLSLDGVSINVDTIKDFFGSGVSGLTSAGSLKELFKLLGKELANLLKAFVSAVEQGASGLADAIKEIAAKVGAIWKKIIALLQKAFDNLDAFPSALTKGPLAAFDAAGELFSLLQSISPQSNLSSRIDVVIDSFAELMKLLGGDGTLPIISQASKEIKSVLKDAIAGGDPKEKLRKRLFSFLVPDDTAVVELLKQATAGKWWAWAELPSGLTPGGLHQWVNDKATYRSNGNPLNDTQILIARRFRTQVVMALDGYLRTQLDARLSAASSDGKMSYQTLNDVITLLIDQVISFVFDPDELPVNEEGLDGFEDLGLGFAAGFGRQIRVAIRGLLGTLFRGVWEYSLHSDALVELLSTVIGTLFSAILEGVVRNITWSLRLVSRYSNDPHGGGNGIVIASLDRTSPPTGSGIQPQSIEYVAFIRSNGLTGAPPALGGVLKGILADLAAYTDSAYLQFHRSKRLPVNAPTIAELATMLGPTAQQFMETKVFPAVATDQIVAINPQLQGNTLRVSAGVNAVGMDFGNLPRPVVRAYFGSQMVVMAPGASPTDDYSMEFKFVKTPRRNFKVTVLSSRGGLNEAMVNV